jgi:hypothetical protein
MLSITAMDAEIAQRVAAANARARQQVGEMVEKLRVDMEERVKTGALLRRVSTRERDENGERWERRERERECGRQLSGCGRTHATASQRWNVSCRPS